MNVVSASIARALRALGGKTLTAKLAISATVLCVLCAAATSAVLGVRIAQMSGDHANDRAELAAREAASTVADEMGRTFVAARTLAATLQGLKASGQGPAREQIDAMARAVLEQHPELLAAYSIWEPNAVDGRDAEYAGQGPSQDRDGRYVAYWNRAGGSVAVEPIADCATACQMDWYAVPRNTLRDAMVEPYAGEVQGKPVMMTTLSSPIVVGGQFVGMAGADLPLSGLSSRLGKMEPMPQGRVSLLSANGVYVAVHDATRQGHVADDLPAEAMARVTHGKPYRFEDAAGWVHLFEPVHVAEGVAPWSVRVSYPAAVAMAESRQALWAALWTALIVCSAAAVAMVWLVRRMMRPLQALSGTMAQLASAEADLGVRLDDRGSDELAVIGSGFNGFMVKIKEVFDVVRRNADGVATASKEIAQGNMDLSSRTEQQASALQQTAASMETLNETVRLTADNARSANELAANASLVARRGGEVMGEVVQTMHGIHEASRRIGDIISTIDGIAFQTNILALNAAVEAARAGEQGRGFAVVASEVRSLAGRSAEAAKAIKTLINDSVERVESGSQLVDRAGQTMTDVVQSIERVTQIVSEISQASSEQAGGVGQVGAAVSEMDRTTQQNAALVEQMAAASVSLKGQADALLQAVEVFDQQGR